MGGIPVILPLTQKKGAARIVLDKIDGLLLTGSGPDIPPSYYNERQKYKYQLIHPSRTQSEMALCRHALKENLPILGICGGTQLLNVTLKGSLVQDIPSEVSTSISHRQKEKFEKTSHWVHIAPDTLLYKILREYQIKVNSSHHQSIKKTGRDIKINAVSPDGVIEGVEIPGHPFALGVQWHPEWMVQKDKPSRKILKAFIDAANIARQN